MSKTVIAMPDINETAMISQFFKKFFNMESYLNLSTSIQVVPCIQMH
jgi:hypothetical protein